MRSLLAFLFLGLLLPVAAQMPPPSAAEMEVMKKLDFWVGRWEGETTIESPRGERFSSHGFEVVQKKLGGHVLLVEALFTASRDGQEVTVHEALSVVWFDERSNTYRMRSYLAAGRPGERELKLVGDQGFAWETRRIDFRWLRFTSKLTESEWNEIGERTTDNGKTWSKFLEMKLRRVQ